MKYIEKLLNGAEVQWMTLGEVCAIKTGKGVTKNDANSNGVYPIISGGKTPMDYIDIYNRQANTVTVSRVGANAGFVSYIKEKFYLNDKCFSVIPKSSNSIVSRFLYYALKSQELKISALQSEGGVPTINTTKLGNVTIPIPPFHVQEEIVRILDKFTTLEAELEAELDCRKRQYEYYRNQLLSLDVLIREQGLDKVEYKALSEVAEIRRGKRLVKSELSTSGNYAVYQNSMIPLGYYSKSNVSEGTTFVISAGSAGEIGYSPNRFWAADDVYYFIFTDGVCSKYVYYFLLIKQQSIKRQVRRASVPRLSKSAFEKLKIPIPSLAEQQRIVSILDKFEALTTSISEGLPKEIELRRKQYEYYRNQLLSFA